MQWYYSPSKRGFYNDEINAGNIPQDAIEITEAERAAARAGQKQEGMTIVPDQNGKPSVVDRSTIPEERATMIDARESSEMLSLREQAIQKMIDSDPQLKAKKTAIEAHANALRNNNADIERGWP